MGSLEFPPYWYGLPYSFPYLPGGIKGRPIRLAFPIHFPIGLPAEFDQSGAAVVELRWWSLRCTALALSLRRSHALPSLRSVRSAAWPQAIREENQGESFGQEDPLLGQSSTATPLGVQSLLRP